MKKPIVLCIMDGYGISDDTVGNAIIAAKKTNLDKIFTSYPYTEIQASGLRVGLPDGQMGNSEVGHTNIGAGRVVYQELTRITKGIKDGDFYNNKELINAVLQAKEAGKKLHIMGLLSSGGVHSHIDHLFALLILCKKLEFNDVYIHAFMDGRDVSPTSGDDFMQDVINFTKENNIGNLATVHGRFYAMDRDKRWERIKESYDALVYGKAKFETDAVKALQTSYEDEVTDEFIKPFIVDENGKINVGDSVIFFNFRPDRARQITRSLVDTDFSFFERENNDLQLNYVCFTQYDATMPNVSVAFKPQTFENTLGEYLASKDLSQLRIAETEKYAHVTFFFDSGVEINYKNEDKILINSPKVLTYDLQPEMSAIEITDTLLPLLSDSKYDFIVLNYANCDMVGHTGNMEAAIKSVETIDACIGRLYDKIKEVDGVLIITSDHGNADKLLDENGRPFTAHTTNPVPFCVVNYPCELKEDKALSDIAPTILEMLNLEKPEEMTGESILK